MITEKIREHKQIPKKTASLEAVIGTTKRPVRDSAFARRLELAIEGHPHAPDKHQGRLVWLKDNLAKRFDVSVSIETCRKWLAGEARPRPDKMERIAQLLEVDPAWLSMGIDPDLGPRERKVRNAMADGAVNLVAGLVQMDGGHPAFPDADDRRAQRDNIDLYAIIKGANYSFHVALGEDQQDGMLRFVVPTSHESTVVLGVIREGFHVQVFEISADLLSERGNKRGGSIELVLDADDKDLRRIESFKERL